MHEPYECLVSGAEKAVVFIHGIQSTPRFWEAYVAAVPKGWSVMSLRLPGHGGTVLDFGRVKWGAWRQHVHDAIVRLKATHRQVYLVGHSMGALLSLLEAADFPENVAGLLLMAVPLRIRVKPSAMVHNILRGVGLAESAEELAAFCGTEQDWRVWRYIGWIPRYAELFSLSRQARKALLRLTTPACAFQHGRDELVSPRSATLLAACPAVALRMLGKSMHHDIAPEDRRTLQSALSGLCADRTDP